VAHFLLFDEESNAETQKWEIEKRVTE